MTQPWPNVQLGEILTERQEVPLDDALVNGQIRIVSKIGFGDGTIRFRSDGRTKTGMILIRPGDLVVSGINVGKGAVAVYGEENTEPIAATIHYAAYMPNNARVSVWFLWWLLRSRTFRDLLLRHVPGGIKTELKAKRFLAIPIPLLPLEEQRRIVSRIEWIAAKIADCHSLRRRSQMEAEVLYTSEYRRLFNLHEASLGWQRLSVEECCEAIIDYRGRTPPLTDSGIPHITSANIRNGRIDWGTSKFVTQETYNRYMTRGIPKAGDVIFTMEAPLGEAAVVPDARRFSLAQRTLVLRGKSGLITGEFLARTLMSPAVRDVIHGEATATTVKGIASKRLKNIYLPVPPLSEQHNILGCLHELEGNIQALTRLQAETAAELNALLPSVLDKAFKREL